MDRTAYALDMAVTIVDGTMSLESALTHPGTITDEGWAILCSVRKHLYREFLTAMGFHAAHIERWYSL